MSDSPGDGSNTTKKQPMPGGATGKGFVKGDPRINRKGRPKTMDALKRLVLAELTKIATDASGKPIIIDGQEITNVQALITGSIHSKDWRRIEYVLNVAYGKVPDVHELTGKDGEPIKFIEVERSDSSDSDPSDK